MNLQRRIYHLNEINHIDVLIDPKEEKKMKRSSRYRILMTILIIIVNIIKLSNIRCLSRSTLFIIFIYAACCTHTPPINIYLFCATRLQFICFVVNVIIELCNGAAQISVSRACSLFERKNYCQK